MHATSVDRACAANSDDDLIELAQWLESDDLLRTEG
jgi:hypothetical protein